MKLRTEESPRESLLKTLFTLWISFTSESTYPTPLFDKTQEYLKALKYPIHPQSTLHETLQNPIFREHLRILKQTLFEAIPPYVYHKLICRIPEPFDTDLRLAWYAGPSEKADRRIGSKLREGWRYHESLGIFIMDDIRTMPRKVDIPRKRRTYEDFTGISTLQH